MNSLTAAEVQVLAALAERPKTVEELARSVADVGMNLGSDHVSASIHGLVDTGLAERTPAEHLGKYRITSAGRAWISGRTGKPET